MAKVENTEPHTPQGGHTWDQGHHGTHHEGGTPAEHKKGESA